MCQMEPNNFHFSKWLDCQPPVLALNIQELASISKQILKIILETGKRPRTYHYMTSHRFRLTLLNKQATFTSWPIKCLGTLWLNNAWHSFPAQMGGENNWEKPILKRADSGKIESTLPWRYTQCFCVQLWMKIFCRFSNSERTVGLERRGYISCWSIHRTTWYGLHLLQIVRDPSAWWMQGAFDPCLSLHPPSNQPMTPAAMIFFLLIWVKSRLLFLLCSLCKCH